MSGIQRIFAVFAALLLMNIPLLADDFDGGVPPKVKLRWNKDRIRIALSASFTSPNSSLKTDSDVIGAVEKSLQKWQEITGIEFELVRTKRSAVSAAGFSGDGVSIITIAPVAENLLVFTRELANASATTRVFFDRSGQIKEADIVLNPAHQFSTDQTFGTFDLESILTHEIGHLLGLEHSPMISSVMFEEVPKNGFTAFENSGRVLSTDDISKVRALYGQGISEPECCSTIRGLLPGLAREKGMFATVWAENRGTGAVVQTVRVHGDGSFALEGLDYGEYAIYAQAKQNSGRVFSSIFIGNAVAGAGNRTLVVRRFENDPTVFDLNTVGINGQLSKGAVRLDRGRNYRLLVGGRALDEKGLSFSLSSPQIVTGSVPTVLSDFDTSLSVVGIDVSISETVEPGQYSIIVESTTGGRRVLIGAIIVS